jgi:urocanate hydratase
MNLETEIREGIPCDRLPDLRLPPADANRAPRRNPQLSDAEFRQAVGNALRYVPEQFHAQMAKEFAEELATHGHIYGYRYRPQTPMKAHPIEAYPAKCPEAAAMMLMIQNNLDSEQVAQHPYELITYGGNGAVFSNWMQYRQVMHALSELAPDETLHVLSGHPLMVRKTGSEMPRTIITNGMFVPAFSGRESLDRYSALGVTNYGQMTAGSWMYIGSQGIVHGTLITVLNAGRLYCGGDLAGKLFVTSGLGGMSGAQAKAGPMAGAVTVIAEVNPKAAERRLRQGWLGELHENLNTVVERIRIAQSKKEAVSIGYLGNVVDLWEKLNVEQIKVDLGSDQTSLHAAYGGGYYPAGLSFEEGLALLAADPAEFKERVDQSIRRHTSAINAHAARGMHFLDYGNYFLAQAQLAGADIMDPKDPSRFRYPSYVEDIMGPLCFDLGFGPFRWVCTSGNPDDLRRTDKIAERVLSDLLKDTIHAGTRQQLEDNIRWIEAADANKLVMGSQARILYANLPGRIALAKAFNEALACGEISAPIVLGRDHHDVSGTDSPFRETSNIKDGSNVTADMSVHDFASNVYAGATWVSLHNGGGVGFRKCDQWWFRIFVGWKSRSDTEGREHAYRGCQHWTCTTSMGRQSKCN